MPGLGDTTKHAILDAMIDYSGGNRYMGLATGSVGTQSNSVPANELPNSGGYGSRQQVIMAAPSSSGTTGTIASITQAQSWTNSSGGDWVISHVFIASNFMVGMGGWYLEHQLSSPVTVPNGTTITFDVGNVTLSIS